jgi:hypothetical protein
MERSLFMDMNSPRREFVLFLIFEHGLLYSFTMSSLATEGGCRCYVR